MNIPHYTIAQLQTIIQTLKNIVVDNNTVFRVSLINAGTDKAIAFSNIQGSGIVYIRVQHGDEVKQFTAWVEVKS